MVGFSSKFSMRLLVLLLISRFGASFTSQEHTSSSTTHHIQHDDAPPTLRHAGRAWVQQAVAVSGARPEEPNSKTNSPESEDQAASSRTNDNSCASTHGMRYIDNWHSATHSLCSDQPQQSASSAICYTQPSAALTACVASGARLYVSGRYKKSARLVHNKDVNILTADILSYAGSSSLACAPAGSSSNGASLSTSPVTVFHKARVAYEAAPQTHQQSTPQGSESLRVRACSGLDPKLVVRHPVLFVSRYDTTNSYHNMEHVLNSFSALASVDISPQALAAGFQVRAAHIGVRVGDSGFVLLEA
jgi:hypothetical protein